MKYLIYILLCYSLVCLTSCENKSVSLGTVEYYPSFLWESSNITPVRKTFEFDFSIDAQKDSKSFAEFQFVDNNGVPISSDVMKVYDGKKLLKDNKICIQSNIKTKELIFLFSPNTPSGKYQGYLKLINHNLDRIESQYLSPGDKVDVFQWTLYYEKVINPLAKTFSCIAIAIFVSLLLWFLILRPLIYPHFGKITKTILIKQEDTIVGQFTVAFKGASKVVFYDKKIRQSIWNRIFIGEIKTYVNPLFKTKLTFSPRKRNVVALGVGYVVNPNPIPKNGVANIKNNSEKISILLS